MATNPKTVPIANKVDATQLQTLASGGSITKGGNTYTADERAIYLTEETIDTTPTANSDNLVTSGGVHSALQSKANASDIPTVNNGTLTIQKNGTSVATFTANNSGNVTANIVVPTTASDIGALPSSTKYGASIDLSINSSTYVVTATLKDQDGNALGTPKTIDLPLESVVVSGAYDSTNKKVILTLQSGSTIDFSVADLVSGLQTELTSSNKLNADYIQDGTTNKTVTATEKGTWNAKQDAISDLSTIRTGAGLGATAVQPGSLGSLATQNTVDYETEVTNKPTIPTTTSSVTQDSTAALTSGGAYTALQGKQNTLPTTSTAGQVLKSTSTAGSVQWGSVSEVKEISDEYIRITDLGVGVYKLNYHGTLSKTKYLYYKGPQDNTTLQIDGDAILTIESASVGLTTYYLWHFMAGTTASWASLTNQRIVCGWTGTLNTSDAQGDYYVFYWDDLKTPVTDVYLAWSSKKLQQKINGVYQDVITFGDNAFNSTPIPSLLDAFPVGAVYISAVNTSPASFLGGTWSQIPAGYALWTATSDAGNTISAGLPNITGEIVVYTDGIDCSASGAFSKESTSLSGESYKYSRTSPKFTFDASRSSSIYGNSSTVQPPAYKVYAWRRTA